jgi:peptidoglycan/LPS O-acetylase OafA/YrhL
VDRAAGSALVLALATGAVLLLADRGSAGLRAIVEPIYAWVVIVGLLALARRYANFDSPVLRYLTAAVFPYYVLHQTLIVCLGAWSRQAALPLGWEATMVVGGTLLGCGLGYELIRRVPLLRPLFGLPRRGDGVRLAAPRPA